MVALAVLDAHEGTLRGLVSPVPQQAGRGWTPVWMAGAFGQHGCCQGEPMTLSGCVCARRKSRSTSSLRTSIDWPGAGE